MIPFVSIPNGTPSKSPTPHSGDFGASFYSKTYATDKELIEAINKEAASQGYGPRKRFRTNTRGEVCTACFIINRSAADTSFINCILMESIKVLKEFLINKKFCRNNRRTNPPTRKKPVSIYPMQRSVRVKVLETWTMIIRGRRDKDEATIKVDGEELPGLGLRMEKGDNRGKHFEEKIKPARDTKRLIAIPCLSHQNFNSPLSLTIHPSPPPRYVLLQEQQQLVSY